LAWLVEGVVDVGAVEVGVVGVAPIEGPELVWVGTHEAVTLLTGPVPGGTSADVGVPGGTLTLKVSVCPVRSVILTVHWSADEAVGITARPSPTSSEPRAMPAVLSFSLLDIRVIISSRHNSDA
jgi:hypothetical protein